MDWGKERSYLPCSPEAGRKRQPQKSYPFRDVTKKFAATRTETHPPRFLILILGLSRGPDRSLIVQSGVAEEK
jgi:hypothetical protein